MRTATAMPSAKTTGNRSRRESRMVRVPPRGAGPACRGIRLSNRHATRGRGICGAYGRRRCKNGRIAVGITTVGGSRRSALVLVDAVVERLQADLQDVRGLLLVA